jgi:hypothetical protein
MTVRLPGGPLLLLALPALVAALGGCASTNAAERAALAQDFKALRAAIVAQHRAGDLDDDAAADIAEASAEGDLGRLRGWRGAEATLAWQACAIDLEDALEDRGDADDDPAAAALWLLVAAGEEDADDFVDHDAPDEGGSAWWRSLGARGLVDDDDAAIRRQRMRDGEERVRLAAIKAADDALDPEDLDALLEAARLDPLISARAAAIRAVGRIGGPHAALGLRDVWTRADPRLRQAVANAWAAYPTYAQGGQRELLRVAEEETGEPAVAAAAALARSGGEHASFGRGALARSIASGTRGERVFAIAVAPHAPEILKAVREAAKDRDPGVAAAALARMAREGDAKEQRTAKDALFALAKKDGSDARAARGELARAGDRRAAPLAEKALVSRLGSDRAAAARDLAALGRAYRASALLADPERDVRIAAACAILSADR